MQKVHDNDLTLLALFISERRDTSSSDMEGEGIHLEKDHLFLKDGTKQHLLALWHFDAAQARNALCFYGTKSELGIQIQNLIYQVLPSNTKRVDNTLFFVTRESV